MEEPGVGCFKTGTHCRQTLIAEGVEVPVIVESDDEENEDIKKQREIHYVGSSMIPKGNMDQNEVFDNLQEYFETVGNKLNIRRLFESDPERFQKFSLMLFSTDNMPFLIDFSKNRIDAEGFKLLVDLAKARGVPNAIEGMYKGVHLNNTESRPVLHVYLRSQVQQEVELDGVDIMELISTNLDHMKQFSDDVINGNWKGYSDKSITDVLCIGDGNADIGPAMVVEALEPYNKGLKIHCLFNRDIGYLVNVLSELNPETVLIIIRSRSFVTRETMMIANMVKDWFLKHAPDSDAIAKHFVAISLNINKVKEFGIAERNNFELWDWVGLKFSMWASNGLVICLSVGFDNFMQLLEGAFLMDCHFRSTPLEKNAPVILALLGCWYINFFETQSLAILPYDYRLKLFPLFLTHLDMESNGKSVTKSGNYVHYKTSPTIWTNGQMPFYEYIHQGRRLVPCDFIAPIQSLESQNTSVYNSVRLCDVVGEAKAMMMGKSMENVTEELSLKGFNEDQIKLLAPFKAFKGNKPSNTILFQKLTPSVLGMLVCMYEMKVFTQGIIWNINSFDSWGNELGRQSVKEIFDDLANENIITRHDESTNALINFIKKCREIE